MIFFGKKKFFIFVMLILAWQLHADTALPVLKIFSNQKPHLFFSEKGFYCNQQQTLGSLVKISFKKNVVYLNGKARPEKFLIITPVTNEFNQHNQKFSGSLQIGYYNNAWHIVSVPVVPDFALAIQALQPKPEEETLEQSDPKYQVRVLLEEQVRNEVQSAWTLHCKSGFVIFDPLTSKKRYFKAETLTIAPLKTGFALNRIPFDQTRICVFPIQEHISWNDNAYQGHFLLMQDSQKNHLINGLDIEDYVFSVLRTESWPGWPLEVNKVFAISSRSYVIGVILNTKKAGLPYHVKNTNKHQTYTGYHTDQVVKEAVAQTKGIFIAYEKKPIIAMFDICCGGVIPAHIRGVNFDHAPYLARSYACTYCKGCKCYSWQAEYHVDQLERRLQKESKGLKRIKDISITKTDKAGLPQEVLVKTASRHHNFTGKKIYSLLDKVKSFCFTVSKKANTIIFKGFGYGHHMGLCQWGAREMVRQGYDHKYILSYYYPNTVLMRLN